MKKLLYLIPLLYLCMVQQPQIAYGAIALNASSSWTASTSTKNTTTSYTIGSGSNLYLICGIGTSNVASSSNLQFNSGGVTSTFSLIASEAPASVTAFLSLWGLTGVSSGATGTIVSTLATTTGGDGQNNWCADWSGVDQTTPINSSGTLGQSTATTTISSSLSITNGDTALAFEANAGSTSTASTSFSTLLIKSHPQNLTPFIGVGYKINANGTTTFAWTTAAARKYTQDIVDIKVAAAGGATNAISQTFASVAGNFVAGLQTFWAGLKTFMVN